MSKKDVTMNHPMSADRQRVSKAKAILDETKDVFSKLDETEKKEVNEQSRVVEPKKAKSLKELLFLGRISKVVELDGFYFKIKTLNNQESRDLAKRLIKLPDEDRLSYANTFALASSIEQINGLSIEDAYIELFGADPELDEFEKCLHLLSELSGQVVSQLIDEYLKINLESKKILMPKTEDDLDKEIKDIKK